MDIVDKFFWGLVIVGLAGVAILIAAFALSLTYPERYEIVPISVSCREVKVWRGDWLSRSAFVCDCEINKR